MVDLPEAKPAVLAMESPGSLPYFWTKQLLA